ncbi:sugar kinase [Heyndrickxia acidiproducens]|uniref:sugar kinase n=1 Tax=Heyndrickxia acidiproducens TaxID=1121084 RepID=UPI000369EA3F|nr:sugar kinase [Heyndrickxia acidiproducens]
MRTYDVITFGEAMGMFIAEETGDLASVRHFTKELAGAETNVAIGLARLGYRVLWLSKVGTDSLGDYIIQELQKEKVDPSLIKRDPERLTGFQLKEKVEKGDPGVQYYRKNSAASQMGTKDFPELAEIHANHYHLTGIPLALSPSVRELSAALLHKARSEGKTISFDPNLRPSLWKDEKTMVKTIQSFACQADYIFPGISEGKILTGYAQPEDIAKFYLDQGAKMVFVKLGAKGAYVATQAESKVVAGFPVSKVVDTVGAGDGFSVGVLSGLFDGLDVFEAAGRGNAIGALATMSAGDKAGLPNREQLLAFMKGYTELTV